MNWNEFLEGCHAGALALKVFALSFDGKTTRGVKKGWWVNDLSKSWKAAIKEAGRKYGEARRAGRTDVPKPPLFSAPVEYCHADQSILISPDNQASKDWVIKYVNDPNTTFRGLDVPTE